MVILPRGEHTVYDPGSCQVDWNHPSPRWEEHKVFT